MGHLFVQSLVAVRPAWRLPAVRILRRPGAIRWSSVVMSANAGAHSLVKELKERGLAESITG